MRWYHHVILGLGACAAAAILASCAHAPRVIDENATVLSIRDDYLRSNPHGKFNEYIRRGEVVQGMSYVEVLASWGFPQSRLRVSERSFEYWRYVARDESTGDWVQYTFVFDGPALSEWEMTRHATKGRAMEQARAGDQPATVRQAEDPGEPGIPVKQ